MVKMRTVMGLDISTNTGVVVLGNSNNVLFAGVKKAPDALAGDGSLRAESLARDVAQFGMGMNVDLVVLEGYAYNKKFSQVLMVELGTMMRYYMRWAALPYIVVPPSRLKQFVAGKGNVKKELMVLGVFKSWNFETNSSDVADAYGLARLGQYVAGSSVAAEPKWRQEVVQKVIDVMPEGVV